MKKYSQWKGIYLAWYSKEFYSDVVLNWRGVAMGYIAVLLLVLWTPVALKFQYEVNSYANGFIFPIIKEIPDLTLKENRLKMEKGSPVTIDNPRTGKPIMIFDLRDDAPRPAKDLDGMFFIGNKEILQYQGKSKEFDLSGEWKDKLITDSMISTMEKFRNYAGITFFLTYCGYSFLFTLSLIFTFGFLGFVSAGFFRRALTYPQTSRIAAVALIPQLTIDIVQRLFAFQIPMWVPVSLVLTLGYVIFGMKAVSVTFNRPATLANNQLMEKEDVEISTNKDS